MAGTALITGASAGIGVEFAKQLSARGNDLVLVARRKERLDELAESLPTTAHVVPCDLGSDAGALKEKVDKLGVQVDLLVNNAGFGLRNRFVDLPADRQAEMVRVNCEAVVTLTHAFVGPMLERGSGGVITVASTAGMQPLPYEAVYGATKAFALNFTEALNMELKGTGVKMLAVNPGPVPTEWQQVAGYDESGAEMMPGAIEADQVVSEALRAYDKGKRSMVPGRFFRNFMRVNAAAPRAMKLRVSERMYRPKALVADLTFERFESPAETREFEKGRFELVQIGGMTVGRATYEPGWRWSEHVGAATGESLCHVEHIGLVVSGQAAVKMEDGTEKVMGPGDLFHVPPGHDSWVVGDEPYVSLHFLGADDYAKD